MKTSFGITFLTAAALALLLVPSAASGEGKVLIDETAARICDGAPETLAFTPMNKQPIPPPKIVNGPCSMVCNSNSNCSTSCYDNSGNLSDCGDYGVCNVCNEALVEIGRVTVAQRANDPFYFTCRFRWWHLVTYRSANSTSCPTYTYCERETRTSHSTGYTQACCVYMAGGCFGTPCN